MPGQGVSRSDTRRSIRVSPQIRASELAPQTMGHLQPYFWQQLCHHSGMYSNTNHPEPAPGFCNSCPGRTCKLSFTPIQSVRVLSMLPGHAATSPHHCIGCNTALLNPIPCPKACIHRPEHGHRLSTSNLNPLPIYWWKHGRQFH